MNQTAGQSTPKSQPSQPLADHQGTVLIVEDDLALRRTLKATLTALGFDIGEAATGEEALVRLRMVDYEVVLLDLNMPGMGGIETCLAIRRQYPRLPILTLTVRDSEDDKILALDSGADDYVTKPFQMRELTARIRSAIRRFRAPESTTETTLEVGPIALDPLRRRVTRSGEPVHLTPREFNVLQILMENAGKPIPHVKLLTAVWGEECGENREYLRVLMSTLRKKLEADPANPEYLLTDSYIGYRFRDR